MLLRTLALISCVVVAGCAAQPNGPAISADNPANASAAEAPLPPESQTLAIQQNAPATTTASAYTCPMHPQVRSERPGKCPICGMKLVPADDHASHRGYGGQP